MTKLLERIGIIIGLAMLIVVAGFLMKPGRVLAASVCGDDCDNAYSICAGKYTTCITTGGGGTSGSGCTPTISQCAETQRVCNLGCLGSSPSEPPRPPAQPANTTANVPAAGSTSAAAAAPVAIINPLGTTDPREFIGRIIRALMSVIGSLTLLMFIYGGVTWMTSMGDDKKVKKGKDIITYAILGLFVVAVAYVAVNAVIKGLSTGSAI